MLIFVWWTFAKHFLLNLCVSQDAETKRWRHILKLVECNLHKLIVIKLFFCVQKPLNKVPISEDALDTMLLICWSNVKFESTSTPRSRVDSATTMFVPWKVYVSWLFTPKCSTYVFDRFTWSCQMRHQFCSSINVRWRLFASNELSILLSIFRSSEKV